MADRDQSNTSNRGFASMDERKQQEIASKGGQASGGNFKNDPARAAEAGRKGGHDVPAEERSFSKDHELAAEAGRKGGEAGHGAGAPGRPFDEAGSMLRYASGRQPSGWCGQFRTRPRTRRTVKPAAKAANTGRDARSADPHFAGEEPAASCGALCFGAAAISARA